MSIQNNDDNIFDAQGYRLNVGIVILNSQNQVFWGRRLGQDAWQFPQGGMSAGESAEQAMFRELWEETGLLPEHVEILGETQQWLAYRLPLRFRRRRRPGHIQCVGQKQKWFLLRLKRDDAPFDLQRAGDPEFEQWIWLDYWQAATEVVHFKRYVYDLALTELSTFIPELTARPQSERPKTTTHKAPSFAKRRKR